LLTYTRCLETVGNQRIEAGTELTAYYGTDYCGLLTNACWTDWSWREQRGLVRRVVSESYLSLCRKHSQSGTYKTSSALLRSPGSPDLASLVLTDDDDIDKYSTVEVWGGPLKSTLPEGDISLDEIADNSSESRFAVMPILVPFFILSQGPEN
jgi:hypothetical protein